MSQAHRNRQTAGNGVTTSYSYDPADGRLSELKAVKGDDVHQHFSYLYDPVGNVRSITNHTHVTRYHANQRIDGIRTFAYDSLYRLESATGLEASGAGTQPELPGLIPPADLSLRQLAQGGTSPGDDLDFDESGNQLSLPAAPDGRSCAAWGLVQVCAGALARRKPWRADVGW